jgi:hypothetical protein
MLLVGSRRMASLSDSLAVSAKPAASWARACRMSGFARPGAATCSLRNSAFLGLAGSEEGLTHLLKNHQGNLGISEGLQVGPRLIYFLGTPSPLGANHPVEGFHGSIGITLVGEVQGGRAKGQGRFAGKESWAYPVGGWMIHFASMA